MNYKQVDRILSFICKTRGVTYGGCVTASKICNVNLDNTTEKYYCVDVIPKDMSAIGHFVVIRISPRNLVYFDSFGHELQFYNKKFIRFFKKVEKRNKKIVNLSLPLQSYDSLVCGLYTIMAIDVLIKIGIAKFKRYVWRKYGGPHTHLNDEKIMRTFYNLPYVKQPRCIPTFCSNNSRKCIDTCRIVKGREGVGGGGWKGGGEVRG